MTLLQVEMHGNATVSSWVGGRPGLPVVASWGQAVQYLDEKKVDQVCSIPPELPQKLANQVSVSALYMLSAAFEMPTFLSCNMCVCA